jgi:hypothetical protein
MPSFRTAVSESAFSAPSRLARAHPQPDVQCFSLRAELTPGLLPRLLEAFAKRGLWPSKFYSQVIDQGEEAMIDIQVAGLDCAARDHIAMQFRGMVGVHSVLVSVKASQ